MTGLQIASGAKGGQAGLLLTGRCVAKIGSQANVSRYIQPSHFFCSCNSFFQRAKSVLGLEAILHILEKNHGTDGSATVVACDN